MTSPVAPASRSHSSRLPEGAAPPHVRLPYAAVLIVVAVTYAVTAKVGLALASVNASATAVWAPSGIALAAALMAGYRVWPAIFLGAFFANATTAGTMLTSLLIASGNTIEAVAGAFLFKRLAPNNGAFAHGRDMFLLMVAALAAAAVSATVGVTTLAQFGLATWSQYGSVWVTWWLGNATGAVVVAPVILLWRASSSPGEWSGRYLAELLGTGAAIVAVGWFVFVETNAPIGFVCIPICVWVAFRYGPCEAAIATCVLSAVAIWGTLHGSGAFASSSTNSALLLLQSFMAVLTLASVTVGVAVAGRRRAEARLRQLHAATESRLEEAQEIAHIGSWEWNLIDDVVWWSDELYRIYGVDPQSFAPTYAAFLERVVPEDRTRVADTVGAALTARQPFQVEHRIARPDGTVRFTSSIGRVAVDDAGNVTRMLGTVQDVTDRKIAEDTVSRSERRLQTIIDAEPACVKLVSRDGRLLDMNRAGLAIIGARDRVEVIGRLMIDLVHPDDRESYQRMHETACAGSPSRLEFRVRALTGNERWVDAHAVPFETFVDGRPASAVLSVTSDVTERKRLEDQLRHSQKMEAVGRLAGGIAHDFNNLLTVIQGFSALLLTRVQDRPDIASELEEVQKAAERAAQLTRQLLAFSRRQLLMPRVLDLNEVVAGLEKMLRRVISEAIDLRIERAPALQSTRADPSQLEQLIINLVVNAADAMPHGGTLMIGTANVALDEEFARRHPGSVPGRYVSLTVRDTGVGMPPDVLAHAFEPFFTTKEPGKGTGLGLSTVYGLVKQSGGYITMESAPGEGTIVTTYLPTVMQAAAEVAPARSRALPALGGTETILLVEDEEGVRELMRKIFTAHGHTVLKAKDGAEALTIEEGYAGPIHLLVSDVVMPGLTGPALAERIVARRPEIAVLFVSGHAGQQGLDLGARGERASFLQKPFTPQSLMRAVRERLDGVAGRANPGPPR